MKTMTAAEHDAFPNGRWSDASAASAELMRPLPPHSPGCLTATELMDLQFCEERIERGLETFLEVGQALTLIRDQRLYRATHACFEEYCVARWDIKASRARQLCAAARLVQGLKAKALSPAEILPTSESQVRPLMSLPAEQQQTVWRQAVATAPNGKVTRQHVATTAARLTGKPVRPATASEPVDVGTRAERLRAAAARAIAGVRELLDLQGTPDSEAASNVVVSLSHLEDFSLHLGKIQTLHSNRS